MSTPLDRLRAALVLRRQRAWDAKRPGDCICCLAGGHVGPPPCPCGCDDRREMPLTVRSIVAAAGWLVLLGLLAWLWFNR